MDLIADSFAEAYQPQRLNARDMPLFEILCRDGDTMRLRWSRQDGFLRFRSVRYYRHRVTEVPNRLLERWATVRAAQGALTVDEIAEIGHLTDVQLDSPAVAAAAIAFYGIREWELVLNPGLRPHWQFLGALPAAQLALACSPKGLSSSNVPMRMERCLRDLAWNSPAAVDRASNRDIIRVSLRVDYTMPPRRELPPRPPDPGIPGTEPSSRVVHITAATSPNPWRVRFIYTYGGPDGGRFRRTFALNSMGTEEPGSFKESFPCCRRAGWDATLPHFDNPPQPFRRLLLGHFSRRYAKSDAFQIIRWRQIRLRHAVEVQE